MFTPNPGRPNRPPPQCPKCEVCYTHIPKAFSEHITPIINDILTTKLALDPIAMKGGSKPSKRKKGEPSYEKKFETYLNDIVLPALEQIQSALLCPEPNNSGESENINSNYYGGSSMKKRKKTLKVMRAGMQCKSCIACVHSNIPQVIKDALNKCIKIINTIILTNGNQITYIGDDSNESIRDKITIDMTNAMKVIQEKSPCPVANNSGESENSTWGGGKRSTRKLDMKKRRKSLRRRRF
jgi:hypothetical protein